MRQLLLIGGGHSHALVLKEFARKPLPADVQITLVSNSRWAPYSGMLPGYVAGHYSHSEVHIDLQHLANAAGAKLHIAAATGIDRIARRVTCSDGASLPYDFSSINIGAAPLLQQAASADPFSVAVKPVPLFDQHWLALRAKVRALTWPISPICIAIVGGGAGGVELLLAMQYRLHTELLGQGWTLAEARQAVVFDLLTQGAGILPTHSSAVQKRFEAVLAQRGVAIYRNAEVLAVQQGRIHTRSGLPVTADAVFWATQVGAPPWLTATGLALDSKGFIQVNTALQSVNDPRVFAAGDIAAIAGYPLLPKAGVIAVRQARPLAANLRHVLVGKALLQYRPQSRWLALISTGNRYAIASYGKVGWGGAWLWHWKDWIDRRFMQGFADLQSPPDQTD